MVSNTIKNYQVAVIGGGAAGLTAALYSSRRGLKTILISPEIGGQAGTTFEIENYPGRGFTTGPELMLDFKNQAEQSGTEFLLAEVIGLEKKEQQLVVKTITEDIQAQTVVLAFGLTPRKLNLPEENNFLNKGLSYCATCDGPLFKNKIVAVVGGGPAGLEAAEYLGRIADKVYLVARGDKLLGEEVVKEKIINNSKIEIIYQAEVKEILGNDKVEKIIITKKVGDQAIDQTLEVTGLFVKVGYLASSAWLPDFVKRDDKGQIVTNKDTETNCPGVFAAGDITDIDYKQIVISAGEGAKAALRAFQYIQKTPRLGTDWGKK